MTLLERLKAETRAEHDRIERTVDLDRLTATLAGYRAMLMRLHGFHSAWEAKAAEVVGGDDLFRRRRKARLIAKDLARLGMDEEEIARLPRCHPPMPLSNEAEAMGSLYVVEGSTLGGAVIARAAERRLGLTAETGCGFFRSYGRETAAMWRSFGTRLLELSSPAVDGIVVASAKRTFEVMRIWLSEAR